VSALWFIEKCCNIGRMTTSGAVTEYPVSGYLNGIATGPDGALWFTNDRCSTCGCQIGRITTAGVLTEYGLPLDLCVPRAITTAPDGALWFTINHLGPPFSDGESCIGSITTAGVVQGLRGCVGDFHKLLGGITAGPDGALWFTVVDPGPSIGRITTNGVMTQYPATNGNSLGAITTGPDGALWFTENVSVARAPACGLGLDWFTSGPSTVTLNFKDLGTTTPAIWSTWLKTSQFTKELWSRSLPALVPPGSFSVSLPFSYPHSWVQVSSLLADSAGHPLCAEWQGNNLGPVVSDIAP
jgi:hypothetical protein